VRSLCCARNGARAADEEGLERGLQEAEAGNEGRNFRIGAHLAQVHRVGAEAALDIVPALAQHRGFVGHIGDQHVAMRADRFPPSSAPT
jgi:hypothetical protein